MFLSWRPDLALSDYPFVVIGAGPAGLYLAQKLAAHGRVLVIEAGNAEKPYDPGEDIYRLVSTGRDYPETGTRLSSFGGSSNHWGGKTRPLTRAVFNDRPGFVKWPISYDDYAAHVAGACKFLNLGPFDEEAAAPLQIVSGLFEGYEHLLARQFRQSDPLVRLGDPEFVEQYRVNPNIDILTDTRIMEVDLSVEAPRVGSISVLHRPSRETAKVAVRSLFLCAGAVENARILLWAARKYPSGNPLAGGPNALTGARFFEKAIFVPVEMFVDSRADFASSDSSTSLCWELSDDLLNAYGLPRFGAFPWRASSEVTSDSPELNSLSSMYAHAAPTYERLNVTFQFEQTPHSGSYVRLSDETDGDGVARAQLNWEIMPTDIEAYRRATQLICGVLSQKGHAWCRLRPGYRRKDWSDAFIGYCNHHMGTTPMGETALTGVVDRDCRLFGVDNLFVAGSSIFPASDYVNPTLSLVAMAGRLADHVIRSQPAGG